MHWWQCFLTPHVRSVFLNFEIKIHMAWSKYHNQPQSGHQRIFLSCTEPLQLVLTTYTGFSSPLRELLRSIFDHFITSKKERTGNTQKVIRNSKKSLFRHALMIVSAAGLLNGHQPSGPEGLFLCAKNSIQLNSSFNILEVSSKVGQRMKTNSGFFFGSRL